MRDMAMKPSVVPSPDVPADQTRVRRNTFFKIIGESSRTFTVLLFILIARFLGGSEFGTFSVAMALATFFAGVADGGLNQLLIRDIARHPTITTDRTELTLGIKICLAPLFLLVLVGFMALCHYPAVMIRLGFYCGLVTATKSGLDYCFAIFSGHEQMQYESALKGVNQLTALALGVTILISRGGIDTVILAMAGANVATLVLAGGLLYRLKIAPSKPLFEWVRYMELAREAVPLTISVIFSALFVRVDTVMLSLFGRPAAEIGQFAAGTRILDGIGTLPMLLAAALFPVTSDHATNRPTVFSELFRRWRVNVLGIGTVTAVLLFIVRGLLVRLTFGPQFAYASHLLGILAFSIPAIFLNYWFLSNLVVLGAQSTVAMATGVAIGANILTNLLVIPRWGSAGASASITFGQFVMCVIAHLRLQKFQRKTHPERLAEIKKSLLRFYESSDAYFRHLDHHEEKQLERVQFGSSCLFDWIRDAESVLEIGCGSGILLERLKQQYPDKRMCGVDLSPIGIEMAKKHSRDKNLDIDFRVSDIETTMPFLENSFDLIISNEVIEHLTNPEAAIQHMAQLLAPGGFLVLVFPNRVVRAPFGVMLEKLWDTIRMLFDRNYIHPRFEMPPFDDIGADADATYFTHPWEVYRMVEKSGLHFHYKSLVRGRLVAQK